MNYITINLDESRASEEVSYMNRATCGLQNSDSPASDSVTPQETTTQVSPDMGRDGAVLSCPGSSVVADYGAEIERVEASTGSETIGPDLVESFSAQSLTEDQEAGDEPIKTDRTG